MNVFNYVDGMSLHNFDQKVVKNVPCYNQDDIDQLLNLPISEWYKKYPIMAQRFNCGTYICTDPMVKPERSGYYVDGQEVLHFLRKKKRGPKNTYYLATPELDKFVYEQNLFAVLTGKISKPIKKHKKNCLVHLVKPEHDDNKNIPHMYLDIIKI